MFGTVFKAFVRLVFDSGGSGSKATAACLLVEELAAVSYDDTGLLLLSLQTIKNVDLVVTSCKLILESV